MTLKEGTTLLNILNTHGHLDAPLLWELLHVLTFYLKSALKDPISWQYGPVYLICSSKITLYKDGSVSIKQGSIGEYDQSLFVAPEYYNTDTKVSTPTATEQIYVYCLGMTIYSAAEFNCDEEVELPSVLEDILIGMVNEVATLRTSLSVISQACQANIPMSKKSVLKDLINKILRTSRGNVMENEKPPPPRYVPHPGITPSIIPGITPPPIPESAPPPLCGAGSTQVSAHPPPESAPLHIPESASPHTIPESAQSPLLPTPNYTTLPPASSSGPKTTLRQTTSAPVTVSAPGSLTKDLTSREPEFVRTAQVSSSTPSDEEIDEDVDPYATSEILQSSSKSEILQSSSKSDILHSSPKYPITRTVSNRSIEDGYSNADELNLSSPARSTNSKDAGSKELSMSGSLSSIEPDNPYGTAKPRCTEVSCVKGTCSHTQADISEMYSTVNKIRDKRRPKRTSSGRVEGFKLDTRISADESTTVNTISPLTMKKSGKPVIVQLPSNKKFQIPADREDTVGEVLKLVVKRLAIEDNSLFSLMSTTLYFIPTDSKLKLYAPDKWKSDDTKSQPVNLKLAVKYFPPCPHKFVNPITRLQFFLNLRTLILDGTYEITKDQAFDLAALALQADHGNYYDLDSSQYFQPHDYVPPDIMAQVSYQYVSKEIPMLHSKLDDMSQNEAVIRYLQIAGQLRDYGVHFFQVNEKNPHEEEHDYIGISLQAVILYQKSRDNSVRRGPAQRIPWNKIMNLSYKNKSFLLDINHNAKSKGKNQRKYNFETDSTKMSRVIMSLCADTHKFYLKLKNMLPAANEDPEPTFSVRDYTPSPRSIITNNTTTDSPDTELSSAPSSKVISRSDSAASKRPPPNDKLVQKYVCLTRRDTTQSLGMTIVGGDGTHGIYVDKMVTGGLANLDGRIRRGDMILSVNGISLNSLTHKEAVELIVVQPCRVELELVETSGEIPYELSNENEDTGQSDASLEIDNRIEVDAGEGTASVVRGGSSAGKFNLTKQHIRDQMSQPSSSKQHIRDQMSRPSSSKQQPWYSDKREVSQPPAGNELPASLLNRLAMQERLHLVRQPQATSTSNNRGYDIASHPQVSGGTSYHSFPVDQSHHYENGVPKQLTRGSSEQIAGSPPEGQQSEDDSLQSEVDWSVSTENNRSSDYSGIQNDHDTSKVSPPPTRDPLSRIFTVYLNKNRGSLGMSIRVEGGLVYVRDVFPNGPAALSGMIQSGDAILSVGGIDLSNMTNQEVINVLNEAPNNVTLVMSWTTSQTPKSTDSNRVGMLFQVTLDRNTHGFGFTIRRTYMGNNSFIRIKSIIPDGSAWYNGRLEEGDILLRMNQETLENLSDRNASGVLASAASPSLFTVYRPDTIRTFNPHKYETGTILPEITLKSSELFGFILCGGYPYYGNTDEYNPNLKPNDRLLRLGTICCQGIKTSLIQSIVKENSQVEVQIFRPNNNTTNNSKAAVPELEKKIDLLSLTDELMEKAETIILHKKEDGLGFSLLGQQDGKRIVHGVAVKTVLKVGAAYDEGRLSPGDLIIMVNGRSMVGITQSKALSSIRKSAGEVVLTVVPGYRRDTNTLTHTEMKLIGHSERSTDM